MAEVTEAIPYNQLKVICLRHIDPSRWDKVKRLDSVC